MAGEPTLFAIDDSFADHLKEAMERAGRLLSVRARTEREIRERLAAADFTPPVIEQALARLVELGLLDDLDFATQWVKDRAIRKSLGPGALRSELFAKGVEREVVDRALAEVGIDEEAQATEAAARWVRRVARYPLPEQAFKLQQMLLRKGFSSDVAEAGARAVLPPEGWD
jgi:regulatory protein